MPALIAEADRADSAKIINLMEERKIVKVKFGFKLLFVALSFFALLCIASLPVQAQPFASKTLYSFSGTTGANPYDYGQLVMDGSSNLYGTTVYGGADGDGTVFELVNSSGTYSEKVLYSFTGGGDGAYPYAGLIMDASGNLYGTTQQGGANGCGTVFELVNSSGTYSEKVLYSFTNSGGDGAGPVDGLIMDGSGNLYGTTLLGGANRFGTVFELVNSSGTYSEKVLYSFAGSGGDGEYPFAGLIMDASGNLYGTTDGGGANGDGTVFELVNSSGSYSEKVLYSFTGYRSDGADPFASLLMDGSGNLYGTTLYGGANNVGTVFELVNSSGTYSEKVLYSFTNGGGGGFYPYDGLIMDASGNLYGTTQNGGSIGVGTVFELANSSGTYSEKVLYSFTSSGGDGAYPEAGLIMDASGNLYGTTTQGGTNGSGIVFEVVNTHGTAYATTTTVTSSANPAVAGDAFVLTATVTASPGFLPTGTVTFSSATLSPNTATLSGGTAQLYLTDVEAIGGIGTYQITAQYTSNNPAFAASSGTLNQTVTEAGVVVTNGNNSLTGTETVNGSVDATSFAGNGSGLTNVLAAGLNCTSCIGNMQLGINYAGSASQGGPASNSLLLNGLSASAFQLAGSYATTGANLFTGNQSITGNLSVTGNSATTGTTTLGPSGTPIVQHLSATFTPTFAAPKTANSCVSQTFTLAGVSDGNTVALGVPNERMTGTDVIYTAWVSAANTITIRACVLAAKPTTLGTGAIRVDVWQH